MPEDPANGGVPSNAVRQGVQRWMSDSRKQSLYFPDEMLAEIQQQALRLDRSLSWIVQQAWRSARAQVAGFPGTEDLQVVGARRPDAGTP